MVRWMMFAVLGVSVSGVWAQSPPSRPKFDAHLRWRPSSRSSLTPRSGRFIVIQGYESVCGEGLHPEVADCCCVRSQSTEPSPVGRHGSLPTTTTYSPLRRAKSGRPMMNRCRCCGACWRIGLGSRFIANRRSSRFTSLRWRRAGQSSKPGASHPDEPAVVGPGVVYPQRVVLPGRNATMEAFVSLLQRAILDRPVVDKTGLSGRYDFDLEWAPDETQFGGDLAASNCSGSEPAPF